MTLGATNLHHAICFHVDEANRADFLNASAGQTIPAWRALAADGVIESRAVFETFANVQTDNLPAWKFLALTRLSAGVTTTEFLSAAEHALSEPHVSIRRAEFLKPTTNSYHPGPPSTAAVYSLEYIRVFDGHFDEYADMMASRTGPAVGALVADEYVHSFLTFDTESVMQSSDGIPDWTAIHVLGLDSTSRWDTFPEAVDPHLRAIDPSAGFNEVFGPLPGIRTMERQVYAHRVEALSIGY